MFLGQKKKKKTFRLLKKQLVVLCACPASYIKCQRRREWRRRRRRRLHNYSHTTIFMSSFPFVVQKRWKKVEMRMYQFDVGPPTCFHTVFRVLQCVLLLVGVVLHYYIRVGSFCIRSFRQFDLLLLCGWLCEQFFFRYSCLLIKSFMFWWWQNFFQICDNFLRQKTFI